MSNIKNQIIEIWKSANINIDDPLSLRSLLDNEIAKISSEDHRKHGFRIQNMFAYVAYALGNCLLVKEEDSGEAYPDNNSFKIPDYKIITKEETFFVEVKNCNDNKICFEKEYVKKLEEYSKINKHPLKIAIYWRKIKKWSLLPSNKFKFSDGKKCKILLTDFLYQDEMYKLKDLWIATETPLKIRLYPDTTKENHIEKNILNFTIGKVELFCNNRLIKDEKEKNIAFQLITSANNWEEKQNLQLEGNKVSFIEFTHSPIEEPENQQFHIVTSLSQIISTKYDFCTTDDKKIKKFRPQQGPDEFKFFIDEKYKGKYLPLWRFSIRPNNEHPDIGE